MLSPCCEYTAKIVDNTVLGAGIAKIDGCAVFINGAVKGDVCRFVITEAKKNFAVGKLIEIISEGNVRILPDCPLFESCGGCTLRHIKEEYEAAIKENTVRSAFSKAGLREVNVNPTVMPCVVRYRNNVQLHFDKDGNSGFYEESSNTVCPLTKAGCAVIPKVLEDIGIASSVICKEQKLPFPEKLALRLSTDGNVSIAVTYGDNIAGCEKLADELTWRFQCITGVSAKSSGDSSYTSIRGDRYLETTLCSLRFRVSPEAFFQVNYEGAELLFAKVTEYAERCKFTHCADLYCGTGVIGMILASRYRDARFTGVEINPEAVEDAKRNAEMNRIGNIDFYCGDAARFAAENKPELVIVDPPRRGLSDRMIEVIKDISPENVIYVSCNPFTLARDVKKLCGFGYKIYEVTPVNMFPRTGHVECVVSLTRGFDNELRERINCAVAYKENERILCNIN